MAPLLHKKSRLGLALPVTCRIVIVRAFKSMYLMTGFGKGLIELPSP